MKKWILIAALSSLASTSHAAIELLEEPAFGGEEQTLIVSDASGAPKVGVEVIGTYYPSTEIEERETICTTDEAGSCTWTPRYSGLVRVRADGEAQVFAVRYPHIPRSGLLIFLVAGTMLFGGLAWSMARLLRAPAPDSGDNDDTEPAALS